MVAGSPQWRRQVSREVRSASARRRRPDRTMTSATVLPKGMAMAVDLKGRRVLRVLAVTLLVGTAASASPARAQFFGWSGWDNGGAFGGMPGPQVRRSITEQGFRVLGPLRRNGTVFVADVIDPRGRHERLIVASSDAQILQRFYVDDGRGAGPGTFARGDDEGGLVPPADIPGAPRFRAERPRRFAEPPADQAEPARRFGSPDAGGPDTAVVEPPPLRGQPPVRTVKPHAARGRTGARDAAATRADTGRCDAPRSGRAENHAPSSRPPMPLPRRRLRLLRWRAGPIRRLRRHRPLRPRPLRRNRTGSPIRSPSPAERQDRRILPRRVRSRAV